MVPNAPKWIGSKGGVSLFLLYGKEIVFAGWDGAGLPGALCADRAADIYTSKGVNTSALYGFTQTLLDIIKNQQPTHLAVAFDTDGAHPAPHGVSRIQGPARGHARGSAAGAAARPADGGGV